MTQRVKVGAMVALRKICIFSLLGISIAMVSIASAAETIEIGNSKTYLAMETYLRATIEPKSGATMNHNQTVWETLSVVSYRWDDRYSSDEPRSQWITFLLDPHASIISNVEKVFSKFTDLLESLQMSNALVEFDLHTTNDENTKSLVDNLEAVLKCGKQNKFGKLILRAAANKDSTWTSRSNHSTGPHGSTPIMISSGDYQHSCTDAL